MQRGKILLVTLVTLGWAMTASAQEGNAWGRYKKDSGDDGTPAAPEPAQVLMIAGGLALAGVYITWRRRKQRVQMPT